MQLSVLRAEFLHPGLEVRPEPEACSPMWGQGDPQEGRAGVFLASVGSGTICPILPISVQMKRNRVKNNTEAEKEVLRDLSYVTETALIVKVKVLVAQSYPTLCNPTDCSPPGLSVHGILQARSCHPS